MPNNEPKPEPKRSAKREKVEKSSSTLASALEPRVWIYFLFLLIFSGVTALFRPYVGLAEAAATLLLFCIYKLSSRSRQQAVERYIASAGEDLGAAGNDVMLNAPFPMVIFRPDTDEVIWSNDLFLQHHRRAGASVRHKDHLRRPRI